MPPEIVQSFYTNCKECGKEMFAQLTQEDVDDGCAPGTLVCVNCLEIKLDISALYKLTGRKPQ